MIGPKRLKPALQTMPFTHVSLDPNVPLTVIDVGSLTAWHMFSPTYQPSRWERLSAPVSEAWRRIKGAWYVLTTGEEWC